MKIKSVFEPHQEIPALYTCLSENISPPLFFEEVPLVSQSLVLIFEDLDASPIPWVHWHLFNIPAETTFIREGEVPPGATAGWSNNRSFAYEGPCPNYFSGTHRYCFRLYALDRMLELPPETEASEMKQQMAAFVLDVAELEGICISSK